jgi:hypothetical protein
VERGGSADQAVLLLVQRVLSDRVQAAAYAADPAGFVQAAGIAVDTLTDAEVARLVRRACGQVRLPPRITTEAHTDSAGGHLPPPAERLSGRPPAERLTDYLHYLLRVSYQGDHYITQLLTRHTSRHRGSRPAETLSQ